MSLSQPSEHDAPRQPRVSVVLCAYNQAEYIEEAIESVLSQTYPNVELVVVDNGSTDATHQRLAPYRDDPRVVPMLHSENVPVTQRLNEGIAASTGEFVSLLYADDYYLPHKLERQMAAFEALPDDYGVVYGPGFRLGVLSGAQWIDASLRRSGHVFEQMLANHWIEGFINPISPLMRRECFARYPFHEDVFVEGESIFLRFALSYKFHFIDEPLVVMREHSSNMGKAIKRNTEIALSLLDRIPDEEDFSETSRDALLTFRSDLLRTNGWLGIRMAADPGWARSLFIESIRIRPLQLFRLRTLVGLAFSLLPNAFVRGFNRMVGLLKRHRETIAFKADYT